MKHKIFFLAFFIFNYSVSYAQKTEVSLALNSGLFYFSGSGAGNTSFFNYNATNNIGYVNNPWGTDATISYGLSGEVKYLTKSGFLVNADLGIELLRNRKDLLPQDGTSNFNGESYLTQTFLNLYPSLGYRLNSNQVSIDLLLGMDLAYSLNAKEKVNVNSSTGLAFSTDRKRETIDFDIRPRPQIGINYKNYGLYIGYSVGTKNYQDNIIGSKNSEVRANYLRFGINYNLK